MEAGGWFMMILSVSAVTGLFGWCLFKVLTLPPVEVKEHLHGELDIETHERD